MRQYFRLDEIQKATGIVSNTAFSRYYQEEFEDELKIYEKRSEIRNLKNGEIKVINLNEIKNK